MADYSVDSGAVSALSNDPEIKASLQRLAATVLKEAKQNIYAMGAVDTGALANSGRVVPDGDGFTVEFPLPYAAVVHEGGGNGPRGPHPYLASAALKGRGSW